MSRTVDEWRGATDDSAIPVRVKLRVLERHGNRCDECGAKFGPALPPEFDHRQALALLGEHREANLRPLCGGCHKGKSAQDVATLAKDRRVKARHLGIERESDHPMPFGRKSPWKRPIHGKAYRRDEA